MSAINLLVNPVVYALVGAGAFVAVIAIIAVILVVTSKSKGNAPEKKYEKKHGKKAPVRQKNPAPAKPVQTAPAKVTPVATQPAPVVAQPAPAPAPVSAPTEEEVPMYSEVPSQSPAQAPEAPMGEGREIGEHTVVIKTPRLVVVDYDRSFEARLIQGDDELKQYYSELRNELEAYKPHSRRSWKQETYRVGRATVVRMRIRGKTLCLYFGLPVKDYEDTKYKVEDASDSAATADTPCLYRIKNERRMRYAKDLIAAAMQLVGREKGIAAPVDYVAQYPYENIEPLVMRGLAKEILGEEEVGEYTPLPKVRKEVSVTEAQELLSSREMEVFVGESAKFSDKSVVAIVNVDTLSEYFREGETATLEEMKKRIPIISKKATFIKVLARGTLNKALTVEADDFSADAIRMIVLTGGKVIRTKKGK